MSLVFAGIVPHPPLLIPSIGKEALKKIEKTKNALEELEESLYLVKPDVVLIISPHGGLFKDAFTVNVAPEYETDLREFGDLAIKTKYKGALVLASKIYKAAKNTETPVATICEKYIDHGSAVPLFYLLKHLEKTPILPVGFSGLSRKTHLDFGYLIKEQIMALGKRVAVIASGDMSHALTTESPAGFNPAGREFDQKIQELLSTGNTAGILGLKEELVENAAECGFRSFLILMGILRGVKYKYSSLCYEAPFGVGYLTANFLI